MLRKIFLLFFTASLLIGCQTISKEDQPSEPPITSKDKPLWSYREGVQGSSITGETVTVLNGAVYIGGARANQPATWKITPPPAGVTSPSGVDRQLLSGGANGRLMSQAVSKDGKYIFYCGTSLFGQGFGFAYKIETGTMALKDYVDFSQYTGLASSANDILLVNDTLFIAGSLGKKDAVWLVNAGDFKKPMQTRYYTSEPVMSDAQYKWVSIDINSYGQLTLAGNEVRFNSTRTYLRVLERDGQIYNDGHMPDEGQYRPILSSHTVLGLWIYSVGKLDFGDGRYRTYSVKFSSASFSGGGSSLSGSLRSSLSFIDKTGWAIGMDEADSTNTEVMLSFMALPAFV